MAARLRSGAACSCSPRALAPQPMPAEGAPARPAHEEQRAAPRRCAASSRELGIQGRSPSSRPTELPLPVAEARARGIATLRRATSAKAAGALEERGTGGASSGANASSSPTQVEERQSLRCDRKRGSVVQNEQCEAAGAARGTPSSAKSCERVVVCRVDDASPVLPCAGIIESRTSSSRFSIAAGTARFELAGAGAEQGVLGDREVQDGRIEQSGALASVETWPPTPRAHRRSSPSRTARPGLASERRAAGSEERRASSPIASASVRQASSGGHARSRRDSGIARTRTNTRSATPLPSKRRSAAVDSEIETRATATHRESGDSGDAAPSAGDRGRSRSIPPRHSHCRGVLTGSCTLAAKPLGPVETEAPARSRRSNVTSAAKAMPKQQRIALPRAPGGGPDRQEAPATSQVPAALDRAGYGAPAQRMDRKCRISGTAGGRSRRAAPCGTRRSAVAELGARRASSSVSRGSIRAPCSFEVEPVRDRTAATRSCRQRRRAARSGRGACPGPGDRSASGLLTTQTLRLPAPRASGRLGLAGFSASPSTPSTKSRPSKGTRSSTFSPTPQNLTGHGYRIRECRTSAPPFAVPSSLARIKPLTGATCENSHRPGGSRSVPVVASSTSRVSCGADGMRLRITLTIFSSSRIRFF